MSVVLMLFAETVTFTCRNKCIGLTSKIRAWFSPSATVILLIKISETCEVGVSVFTLTLKPTAKNLSGHISGQVQFPNCSPLFTVSMDLYCLLLKATPARCRKLFSSQSPPDSMASRATAVNRLAILTAVNRCFTLKCQLTSSRGSGSKLLYLLSPFQNRPVVSGWIIYRAAWE